MDLVGRPRPRVHKRRLRSRDSGDLLGPWVRSVVIVVLAAFVLIPIGYMVLTSMTPEAVVAGGQIAPSLQGLRVYSEIWDQIQLLGGIVNSVIIAGGAALAAVAIGFGGAYALSRLEFRGRLPVLYSLLVAQSIPGAIILFPLYIVFISIQVLVNLTLVGSYPIIVLTYTSFALPFAMWLLASYMASIPRELEEAAMVDGATRGQILRSIVVPLARPGAVVAFIFAFLLGWNDVLFASVLTNDMTRTVAVVLQVYSSSQDTGGGIPQYAHLMAASIVSAVPVVTLYLIFQRYLSGGLTLGAVK